MNVDDSKPPLICDISADILKSTVDIHLPFLTNGRNLSMEKGCFHENFKLAEVSPIFEKKDDLEKRELQTCQCFTARVKSLWKNTLSSNKWLHDRQIIKTINKI